MHPDAGAREPWGIGGNAATYPGRLMSMRTPPGERPGPIGILARLGALGVAAVVAGVVAGLMFVPFIGGTGVLTRNVVADFQNLPDSLSTPPLPQRSLILASDGSVLATLYYQNRVDVPLSSISPAMRQATVAIEDSRFLQHNGVDLRGIMRSLATNASAGGVEQGSSTLTMQYVKNVLVNQATSADQLDAARGKSATRKIREVRYALGLEKLFSKGEILERYLNIAYFGAGAYGVEAASRRYFSKPAADLTLPEAATLAGIVQQPTAYDPLRNPELSTVRRNVVLKRMAELGYVTQDEADRAALVPMTSMLTPSVTTNGCTSSYAPYFCDYVVQTIRQDPTFGSTPEEREAFLRRGGYTIRTTLDPKAQNGADETVNSYIPAKDASKRATAITMVEPGTGHILAMTQNRQWGTSGRGKTTYNYNVDRAMGGTIGMQAGSTFKVFAIAAALEAGISPFEYIPSYSPKTFTDFRNCTTDKKFAPVTVRNSTSSGTFDMARATAYSVNTYFMSIEERTGICRPAEIAESMGVRLGNGDPLLRVPTLAIGTMEVTPLAMANAYATFAAHGIYCKPVVILDIADREGNPIPVPDGDCTRVIKRDVADTVTVMLNGVVDGSIPGRTGQAMVIPERQVAGKTGTTNDSAAVWFAGYTPQIAAAVWVGDPRGGFAYPMKNVTVNGTYYSQVFGGTLPGPIWRDAMEKALAGTEPLRFDIKNKYGLTTKDPYTYTYVPNSSTGKNDSKGDTADTFTGTGDGTDTGTTGTDTGNQPAPPASGPPAPTEPGTFDNG
jgi:membrane peptidoglycan carboxypeptidase